MTADILKNASIGLKHPSFSTLQKSLNCHELSKKFGFFEYFAPVLDPKVLSEFHNLPITKMRPHGNSLSTYYPEHLPKSIISKLKENIQVIGAKRIVEHIGYLNPNKMGPSLGYLFSPPLNKISATRVSKSFKILSDCLKSEILIENPAIYSTHKSSNLKWGQFIHQLDKQLPDNCHWLIDFAHLLVYVQNTGAEKIEECLSAYARTSRKVAGIHFANVKRDRLGVYHDDHSSSLNVSQLEFTFSLLKKCGIYPEEFIIERDGSSTAQIVKDFELVMKVSENKKLFYFHRPKFRHTEQKKIVNDAETKGRRLLSIEKLKTQLSGVSSNALKSVSKNLNAKSFDEVANKFFMDSFHNCFQQKHCVPYFSATVWDGNDLLGPFVTWLACMSSYSVKLKTFFIEVAACIKANTYYSATDDIAPRVYLIISPKELYEFQIDKNDSVFMLPRRAIVNKHVSTVILISSKGVVWQPKKKKRKKLLKKTPRKLLTKQEMAIHTNQSRIFNRVTVL